MDGDYCWFTIVLLCIPHIPLIKVFSGSNTGTQFGGVLLLVLLTLLVVFLGIAFLLAKLRLHFYRYELTEDGYKAERGIIWKRYISIPYGRIQNVDIYRGLLDRILGLSTLNIQTAGYGGGMSLYGKSSIASEGRLPGLDKEFAEEVREHLIKMTKDSRGAL